MTTLNVSHSALESVYNSIQDVCDILNGKFDTNEISMPYYSFDSFLEFILDSNDNGYTDFKMVLATGKHRIACFIRALSTGKISINYTSLNATRANEVKKHSTTIDVTGTSLYSVDLITDDAHDTARRATYIPSPKHDEQIHDVALEYNNSSVIGNVSEILNRIKKHRYFDENNKNIANYVDFIKFLIRVYHVRGTEATILTPIYAGYPELSEGIELTNDSEVYNLLAFIANDLDKDQIFKSALENHFNGLCIGSVASSDTLLVSEGMLNTAITHYALHTKGKKVTGIALNGITGYKKFLAALAKIGPVKSQYKNIIIVPDNDGSSEKNDGMTIATQAVKKLLNMGFNATLFDAYVGTSAETAANIKSDAFDAFNSLGADRFINLVNHNSDICSTISEFTIRQRSRGFSKKHKNAIAKLLKQNKGKYLNWSNDESVKKLANTPLFGSIPAVLRAICVYLNIPYSTHIETLQRPQVSLDTVSYNDGKPSIDTKKEMFFGGDNTPILVKAPMGAGKTDNVIRPFLEQTNNQSLIALPNIALTKQIVTHFKDLKVKHYKDSDGNIKGRVVTTIDSLGRFYSSDSNRAILVDEIQQVISLFCSEDRLPNKLALIEQIKSTIDNNKIFIGTSADIDDSTVVFFEKLFKRIPKVAIFGTTTEDNTNKDITASFYKKVSHFRAAQLEATDNNNKILFVTDSLKEAEKARAFYQLRGYKAAVISSKTKDSSIYKPNEIDSNNDVIIITPSASVGVSFTATTRTVFAYYTGTIDTDSFVQLISRSRKREGIHVYERLITSTERHNILKKQAAKADYAANNARLAGISLDLLVARSEFKSINDLSVIEALVNQGYKPDYVTDVPSEYLSQDKKIIKDIREQHAVNQQEELNDYKDIAENLTEQEVKDMLTDKGVVRNNDKQKMAATLRMYNSLSIDGINALNEKWFSRVNIAALELDYEDYLVNVLNERQASAKGIICATDFTEIKNILMEYKDLHENGRTMVEDYYNVIEKHFINSDAFTLFHSNVLNYLGIKVTFLHGALNYEKTKINAISKITVALLNSFGYYVYKKEVMIKYDSLRNESVKIAYDNIIGSLSIDEVYAAINETHSFDAEPDETLITF